MTYYMEGDTDKNPVCIFWFANEEDSEGKEIGKTKLLYMAPSVNCSIKGTEKTPDIFIGQYDSNQE